MKMLINLMRILYNKKGLFLVMCIILLIFYFLDMPQNPSYSSEESYKTSFSIYMDKDFPNESVRIFDGPSLDITILTPQKSEGMYDLTIIGNTEGISGTIIFILPVNTDIYDYKRIFNVSKETYGTIVRVPFIINEANEVVPLVVPFEWNTEDISKRNRYGEYVFEFSEKSHNHIFDKSTNFKHQPISSKFAAQNTTYLRTTNTVKFKDNTYKFIEPSSEAFLEWKELKSVPSFDVRVKYRNDRLRYILDNIPSIIVMFIGIIIGQIYSERLSKNPKNILDPNHNSFYSTETKDVSLLDDQSHKNIDSTPNIYLANSIQGILKGIPYIGASLEHFIFGPLNELRMRRIESTLKEVAEILNQKNYIAYIDNEYFVNLFETVVPSLSRSINEDRRKHFRNLLLNAAKKPLNNSNWDEAKLASELLDDIDSPGLFILAEICRSKSNTVLFDIETNRVVDVGPGADPIKSPRDLQYAWPMIEEWAKRLKEMNLIEYGRQNSSIGIEGVHLTDLGNLLVRWILSDFE